METRKKTRKAFPYSRKILQIFQKSGCRDFSIEITPLDSALLEKIKPLSDSEIARILENDAEPSPHYSTLSPRAVNRLRKKENGMVSLPRSSYNEHPAKKALFDGVRGTRSKSSTKNKGGSSRQYDRATPQSRSPAKHRRSDSRNSRRSDPAALRNATPNTSSQRKLSGRGIHHKEVALKSRHTHEPTSKSKQARERKKTNGIQFTTNNNEKEYQIVLSDPITRKTKKQEADIEKLSLSELLNTEQLPSKLWEVERVPPLMVNTKSDTTYNTIAAELDALMAEDMEVDITQDIIKPYVGETSNSSPEEALKIQDDISTETVETKDQSEKEHKENDPSDDVEMIAVAEENNDTLEANKDFIKDENTPPESDAQETLEAVENDQKLSNDETKESLSLEVKNDTKDKDIVELCDSESGILENSSSIDTKISPEVKSEKVPEEFPSIMDLLNEKLSTDPEEVKQVGQEQTDEQTTSQQKSDSENSKTNQETTPIENPEVIPADACTETIVPQDDTAIITSTTKVESKDPTAPNSIITSVIFRRFSSDKQTYDRLVIFQSDLEYTVKINNKEVELLGAPRYMTSTEDLQILLQIVDEVSLDSFNVICKS